MAETAPAAPWSGVRVGPLQIGERITLTDPKGRRHSVVLAPGGAFHTTKGSVSHDELIDGPEGVVVTSVGGTPFLAMRPLLNEFTVTMPRGAAVVYPKDAAQLLVSADIFPGARVLEAGAGSGALTCFLLRAVGETGRVTSYERREDFAAIARRNVDNFFGALTRLAAEGGGSGDRADGSAGRPGDPRPARPWECVTGLAEVLVPGGVLCATWPPRPSSRGPWRRSACTAVSPSRWRPRPWSVPGTRKD